MASLTSGKRLWTGTALLLMGLFYLVHNFNLLPFAIPRYLFSWPMALVLFGVYLLYHSWTKGLVVIAVGVAFLLPLLGLIPPVEFRKMWPLLLIALGLLVLFGSGFIQRFGSRRSSVVPVAENAEETFDLVAIMGGESGQISSYNFKGGKITAIMGGVDLDLTNCYLAKEGCVIDVSVVMGGVRLKVSREWNIKSEIVPIMSGIEDSALHATDVHIDPAALVILKGSLLMGGIEIQRA